QAQKQVSWFRCVYHGSTGGLIAPVVGLAFEDSDSIRSRLGDLAAARAASALRRSASRCRRFFSSVVTDTRIFSPSATALKTSTGSLLTAKSSLSLSMWSLVSTPRSKFIV